MAAIQILPTREQRVVAMRFRCAQEAGLMAAQRLVCNQNAVHPARSFLSRGRCRTYRVCTGAYSQTPQRRQPSSLADRHSRWAQRSLRSEGMNNMARTELTHFEPAQAGFLLRPQ